MSQLFNLAKISLCVLLLTSISSQAHAQTATVFKTSDGAIYLYGREPSGSTEVGIVGNLVKAIASNECGLLLIRTDSAFSVDGQTINPNAITDVRTLTSNCTAMSSYPNVFKTPDGMNIAIKKSSGAVYAIAFPNHKTTRQVSVNACGYAVLRNVTATSLNLPAITGVRADFALASFPQAKPLACVKGALYFPIGFNPKSAVASAIVNSQAIATPSGSTNSTTQSTSTTATTPTTPTTATTPTTPTTSTASTTSTTATTVSAQTAQPQAAKSGNKLIITSIPPGTYTVANAANPSLKKSYTVTNKACLIGDRAQLGNATNFLVSRQGLTFPVSWTVLPEITAAVVPSC
jgi:hypothetical protein